MTDSGIGSAGFLPETQAEAFRMKAQNNALTITPFDKAKAFS